MFKRYNFNDPIGIHTTYQIGQRNNVWGEVIGAVGNVAGGAIGASGGGVKIRKGLSPGQKRVDEDLMDFLLGRKRNARGKVVSQRSILADIMNRIQPKRMVAGFTDTQKDLFNRGRAKIDGATNLSRPDLGFVEKAKGEILGNALGNTGTTEPFVAGEGGHPEVIIPKGDGSVEVIPNAETFKSREELERVLGESKKITDRLNIDGKATGTDSLRRKLTTEDGDSFYFNEANFGDGGYFDTNTVGGAAGSKAFNQYLNTRYGPTDDKDLFNAENQFGSGNLRLKRINNRFGSIGDLPFAKESGHKLFKDLNQFKQQSLSDFFETLESTSNNQEVTDILAGVENLDDLRGFFNENRKFGFEGAGNLTMREGQLAFQDPFGVDTGNLQAGIDAFNTSRTEAPSPFEPGNFTNTVTKLTDGGIGVDNFQDFNTFLDSYAGGALQGQGLRYDPATNQLQFDQNAAGNVQGIDAATDAYLASIAPDTGDGTGDGGDGGTDTDINPGTELANSLIPAMTALANQQFDPTTSNELFQSAIGDPSRSDFQENTVPAIRESFAGGNLFGSQREQAEQRSRQALDANLASERANYVSNSENNFHARQQVAIDQAMDLAALPTEIANAKISGDAVKASIVGTFADIEIREALANSELSYAELSSLVLLQNYFGPEQAQEDSEWNASYINAISGAGGLDMGTILGLYTNKLGNIELTAQ